MDVKVNYRLAQGTRANLEIFGVQSEVAALIADPTLIPKEFKEMGVQPAAGSYFFATDSQRIFMFDTRTNTWREIE